MKKNAFAEVNGEGLEVSREMLGVVGASLMLLSTLRLIAGNGQALALR